ncbi:MAG: hypothetical protein JWQ74_380 [Marmoricola sp.]|nr:hypothetical protein [Marmoricola sp.]
MRNPKLLLVGALLTLLAVVLVALVPHADTHAFWTAYVVFVVALVAGTVVSAAITPRRDFTVWLPAGAALTGYVGVTFVLVLVANVLPLTPLIVLEVIALVGAGVLVIATAMHEDALVAEHDRYDAVAERFEPKDGGF